MRLRVNTERFVLRAPQGFTETLAEAARRHHCQPVEYARRLLMEGLQREGLSLPPITTADQ